MTIIFNNKDYKHILEEINLNKNTNNDNICDICREPLLIDTVNLTCDHKYHSFCLKETFIKYETKKCPLCSEVILWDSFKDTCTTKKKDGNVCNRICYNDELICSLHINTYLKSLEKAKQKNEKDGKKDSKLLEKKLKQLKKIKKDIKKLEDEINEIKLSIIADKVDIL
jgi:hypothetical protein